MGNKTITKKDKKSKLSHSKNSPAQRRKIKRTSPFNPYEINAIMRTLDLEEEKSDNAKTRVVVSIPRKKKEVEAWALVFTPREPRQEPLNDAVTEDIDEMNEFDEYTPTNMQIQKLCNNAEKGDTKAMSGLLELARSRSINIDFNKEMSLDRLLLAALSKQIKYLLGDKGAILASLDSIRDSNRPPSEEIKKRDIKTARDIRGFLATNDTVSKTTRNTAITKAVRKAAASNGVSIKTAQLAYRKYRYVADREEEVKRILLSKHQKTE